MDHNHNFNGENDKRSARYWKDPSFRRIFKFIHIITDICPYWSQVTLTLALALERYILICHGMKAEQWLSTKNRTIFYVIVGLLSFLLPTLIMAHYLLTGLNQDYDDFEECWACFRQDLLPIEFFGRIPLAHIPTIAISALLYRGCVVQMRSSNKLQRKDLLIRVFILLLVSWVIMVTPHVVFQDMVLRGQWFSFGTLMQYQYYNNFYESNWESMQKQKSSDDHSASMDQYSRLVILSIVEPVLRCLKLSFGFVNSILLIILIKPFHEPLIEWKKLFEKQFGLKSEANNMKRRSLKTTQKYQLADV